MDNKNIFKHPFTMSISGSTGSGKTEWIMRFLQNLDKLIENGPIKMVLYCYGELNGNIVRLQKHEGAQNPAFPFQIKTYNGIPSLEDVKNLAHKMNGQLLVILDDLMVMLKSEFLDTLFTRGSHNWGLSVVLVTQHLFAKEVRTARANSHYLLLMKNPSGALQIRNLAVQLFPQKMAHFMEAFQDATAQKFGYLLIDLHPKTDEDDRLKSAIFPGEYTINYLPSGGLGHTQKIL